MKYRKKPVEIKAFIWDPQLPVIDAPEWYFEGCGDGKIFPELNGTLTIDTLEGKMVAQIGDYIIKGVLGEIYPCKPDIFELTYEKVD